MNFDNFQRHSIPKLFIFFIPIYFLFESFSGYMFDKNGIVSYMFGGFWVLYFIFMHFKIGISKHSIPIIIFLLYLLFKVTMSSDILNSINQYATLFISMSIFPIAFKYFNNFKAFTIICNISLIFLVLYLSNLIVSNISLNSSFKGYVTENQIWNTGNIFTNGLNSVAYLAIALPITLPFLKKRKFLYMLLLIISIITVIITFKRISILAIPIGYLVFFILNKDLIKIFKYSFLMILFIITLFPFYGNILEQQLEARKGTFSRGLTKESRYMETVLIWNKALSFSSFSESFFGKEMFNSVGKYGLTNNRKRGIHVDYNQLLHGSGFVGLFLFLYIHLFLIQKMIFYTKITNYGDKILPYTSKGKKIFLKYSPSVYHAFIIVSLFLSMAGGFNIVLFNSFKFLFLGSIMGIWHNIYIDKNNLLKNIES